MSSQRSPGMKESAQDPELEQSISAYVAARAKWLTSATADGDLMSQGECFEAVESAGLVFIHHPCRTFAAIRRKVSFLLDNDDLYTIVREDADETGEVLRIFLTSLIAEHSASQSHH